MGGRGTPVKKIPVRQLNKELQQEMRELQKQLEAEEAAKRAEKEAKAKAEAEAKKKAEEEKKKKVQKTQESQKIDFTSQSTKSQAVDEFVNWFNKQKSTKEQFTKIKASDVDIDNEGNITAWTGINSKFAKTWEARDTWIVDEDVKLFFKADKKKGKKKFSFDFRGSKQ